jgi:hypothetical protein
MSEVTPIRSDGAGLDRPDGNALMVAKNYPAVAPLIEREFKRICPTLELLDFNAGPSRMESIIYRFRKELIAAIEVAAVVDTQAATLPSHLRLVVDSEVRHV